VPLCNNCLQMFNEWMLQRLQELNWSQADLARASGLTRTAISNYINGRTPDESALRKLAKAFKLPPKLSFAPPGFCLPCRCAMQLWMKSQIWPASSPLNTVFPIANIQTRRSILYGLIIRIDVDRDGRRIFGTITVDYPPDDLLSGLPPSGKTGGGQTVRLKSKPSGPPRYTHSFDFETQVIGLSGRYKNSCS
jgi:transcriptional regulator with XRE-family HTH domain